MTAAAAPAIAASAEGSAQDSTAMDEQQFQLLYDATARPIHAYLIGVTGQRDIADDVLQETYFRFLQRHPAGMPAAETRPYLFRIATNLLRDRWRTRQDAQWPEGFDHGHANDIDTQLDMRRVMQALKPRETATAVARLRRRHESSGDRNRHRPRRSQHPATVISCAQKGGKPAAARREDLMTREKCERESSVAAASRSGNWSAELEHHVAACAPCAETKRVAQLFLDHAATTSAQSNPPAANVVWRKMQAQRKQQALIRAPRCMTWMRIMAALYAVALAAWYLPQLWQMQPAPRSTALRALASGMVFTGVVTAIVAVVLGSCCVVHLGSRTTFRLRSE